MNFYFSILNKSYKLIINCIILIITIAFTDCVYRQDAYKIFDKFTVLDTLNLFKTQLQTSLCKSHQGPNCYFLTGRNFIKETELVNKVISHIEEDNKANINLNNIIDRISIIKEKFLSKNKGQKTETFNISPKIVMNLLLNFESFDPTTVKEDQYMPAEKIISFNVGYLKLSFKGTLRITQDRINGVGKKIDKLNPPYGSYGVVDKRDLFLKFDKPVMLKSIYVRCKPDKFSLHKGEITIKGYRYEKPVINVAKRLQANYWTYFNLKSTLVDTVLLPKDFEYDDISIIHDSGDNEEEDGKDNPDLAKLLQSVLDEIVDKKNKIDDED